MGFKGEKNTEQQTGIDHGLNGKSMPGLHDANGLVFVVVGHVGRRVEEIVDAVTAVRLDDAKLLPVRDLADNVANVAVAHPRLALGNGCHEAVVRRLDETKRLVVDPAHKKRLVEVAVEAVVVQAHVD